MYLLMSVYVRWLYLFLWYFVILLFFWLKPKNVTWGGCTDLNKTEQYFIFLFLFSLNLNISTYSTTLANDFFPKNDLKWIRWKKIINFKHLSNFNKIKLLIMSKKMFVWPKMSCIILYYTWCTMIYIHTHTPLSKWFYIFLFDKNKN